MTEKRTPHLQKVQEIRCSIIQTRNEYVDNYRRKRMGKKGLTYDPGIDRAVYQTLQSFHDTPEQTAYIHAKNELNAYTSFQVETFIGERLHAGLSEFRYDLKDGVLYGQGMNEPLLDMIKRGKDCRDEIVNDVDKPRQDAEIVQFQKIQEIFGKADTPIGTTIVSMSPRGGEGSAYTKNFDDIFVLSEDKVTKERFIAAKRFASGLSLEERKTAATQLQLDYFAEHSGGPLDSYFLSHPLVLSEDSAFSGKPEEIHQFLHKNHEFLSTEDFAEVRRSIAGLIMSYVNTLCDTPGNKELLDLTLNAIMNKADHTADTLRRPTADGTGISYKQKNQHDAVGPASLDEIHTLGNQKVRSVSTGCGDSSGFGQDKKEASNVSSFSMRDFGTDKLGNRVFDCPECGAMNVRPYNQTVSQCQNCGSEKVAC